MKTLPENLASHRRPPTLTEQTVTAGLLKDHQTKSGVWRVIRVESGRLNYVISSRGQTSELLAGCNGGVEPEILHHVTPNGPVRFHVEFFR